MTERSINNMVTLPVGAKIRTIRATMALRWYHPYGHYHQDSPRVLQQAWECVEDGSVEWKDIPIEIPK